MKTYLLFIVLLIISNLSAQDYTKNRIPCEPVVYPIQFYFVHNHPLRAQRNANLFHTMKDTLNTYFKNTCIQFQICKIDTIHDYNYLSVTSLDDNSATNEISDIRAMHYNPHAINVYWVSHDDETFMGICEEKRSKPYIMIGFVDFLSNNTRVNFCRQFFRYFGLPNTASYAGSLEFVNTQNGKITADSIWDTPADPSYLTFASPDTFLLPPFRSYLYTTRKDPNGEYYNPMVYNPMFLPTNIPGKAAILTHEQNQRIVNNERKCRKRFWNIE